LYVKTLSVEHSHRPAWFWRCASALTLLFFLGGALAQTPREPPFQNQDIEFQAKGVWPLLQWRLEAMRAGLPPPPAAPIPSVKPDSAFIHANAQAGRAMVPAATWIGHASVLLQIGGVNILTDPIFSERASPVSYVGPKRAQPPGLGLRELPRIDVVVVSHNHYDHCDLPSLKALQEQPGGPPLLLLPLGNRQWAAQEGLTNVRELDWWQSVRLQDLEIMLTPVQHWSGRGLGDRMQSLWGGYAFLADSARVFFSGDTGYSKDFTRIAQHLEQRGMGAPLFDLALIAVGAYEPRWFMKDQHINPAEAVQVHQDLRAARSIGIHWGTFELTDEALDEPPRALARARAAAGLSEEDFRVLAIGQTYRWPTRAPGATQAKLR
jgi:N-acyl-phosphatidylethanolamine-hydrolysing phospholipase D